MLSDTRKVEKSQIPTVLFPNSFICKLSQKPLKKPFEEFLNKRLEETNDNKKSEMNKPAHIAINRNSNLESTPYIHQQNNFYIPARIRSEFKKPITSEQIAKIDYKKDHHFVPQTTSDFLAHSSVLFMRKFADIYFRKDYNRRVVVLETVAAIPGMVGGLFRHLYSLRKQKDNGDKIKKLLEEAENERQHLLAFLSVRKPGILDQIFIQILQPGFFGFYSLLYFFFPRIAHRFVGYLEEEAVRSYDLYEKEILEGNIENVDAPLQAKIYWNMPKDAKLIDLVRAIRADEAAHRDENHAMASEKPFSL